MDARTLTGAQRKVIDLLKRQAPATSSELAGSLGLTDVAVRQHLQTLEAAGLAKQEKQAASGRGRPAMRWTLTDSAGQLFPDRHGELSVGLIESVRRTFGEEGLQKIIQTRANEQARSYRSLLPPGKLSLKSRVEALARQRTAEGYMAEVVVERPGHYLLIEHHCPICEAASCCLRLCGAELEVFQKTLGPDIVIERTEHLLSGGRRCIYRIRKK